MGILSVIGSVFSGGTVSSVESIAKEWIETDLESAEAKAMMVKTLDPNGLMRRDQCRSVTMLYTLYMLVMIILIVCEFFGYQPAQAAAATGKLTDLFIPITGMYTAIIGASFGVNGLNVKAEEKRGSK